MFRLNWETIRMVPMTVRKNSFDIENITRLRAKRTKQ